MTQTNIIFMGTIPFSATVLDGLLQDDKYKVIAVVTQPDRKVGRKQKITPTPVKELALAHEIPVYQPEKLSGSPELAELMEIASQKEVGIVTAAFGQFLSGKLLDAMKFSVNVHGSLLPQGRGGAPIQRAIMAGDKELGVTIIEMVRKMDAGAILAQRAIPCLPEDNTGTMFDKLAILGRDLLLECLPDYLSGKLIPELQNEAEVTISPNIAPEEEIIDWSKSATDINNQIRGLSPQPGAYTLWQGQRFKIYESEVQPLVVQDESITGQGQVIERTKKSLTITTAEGFIAPKLVQPFGKAKMSITDFLNGVGRNIKVGDQFGK